MCLQPVPSIPFFPGRDVKTLMTVVFGLVLTSAPLLAQQAPGKASVSRPAPVNSPEPMTMLALAGGAAAAGGVLARRRPKDEDQ